VILVTSRHVEFGFLSDGRHPARKERIGMASRKNKNDNSDNSNRIKDPDEWTTGDEPMTGAQESYLHTLATEAGETVEPDLSKAEASKRIDELQDKTGRG
jgi:hypothetical protein